MDRRLSMCSSLRLQPLQKSTIDINGRIIGRLAGDVNLEVSENMSNNQPVWEISTRIIKCSDNMKLIRSLGILTLMTFRRQ